MVESCSACGAELRFAELLNVRPSERKLPDVACRTVWDCPGCGAVYTAWAAEGEPLERMPDDLRELRARIRHALSVGLRPWPLIAAGAL